MDSFGDTHALFCTSTCRWAVMATFLAFASVQLTGCDKASEDEDIARCDRVATKYVEAFAAADAQGPARELALKKCVLGPEKTYTEHGQTWVECMDEAISPGEMVNCEKTFDLALKNDALEEVKQAVDDYFRPAVCDGVPLDDLEDKKALVEAAKSSAHALGATDIDILLAEDIFPSVCDLACMRKELACK